MAIYHLSCKTIGRSGGSSVVNSAAYRSGEKLYDQRLEQTFYYANKKLDVMHKEIMTPEKVPGWAKSREKLWNQVEFTEKRKDSQLAREVEISLPREFSVDQNIALVREYVQKEFVDKGMIADVCMHYGIKGEDYNPHAHVLLTMRNIDQNGFGKKNVSWNDRGLLKEWRESWSELSNKHLSLNGIDQQIDHRTLKEQGIDLVPQNVELPNDAKERLTEQRERQLEIMRENGERLKERPEIALQGITNRQSTFTERDIARYVNSRTVDRDQFNEVFEKVKNHDALVKLVGEKGNEVYTTKEMLNIEQKMFKEVGELSDKFGVKENKLEKVLENREFSKEQEAAVEYITQKQGMKSIVGYAGTGKTYMLDGAREVWESSGYRVKGAALSGIAAQGLQKGAGIESRTVARRLIDWSNGRDQLSKKDVLVVDEAGMLGLKDISKIVSEVKSRGAKLVMIGDPQQLQAIEAGAAFRGIAEREGYLEMNNIRRQDIEWQKDATKHLALGEVGKALSAYNMENKVHYYENKDAAMGHMVQKWMEDRKEMPNESQIMLAYKRIDVKELNEKARELLKKSEVLDVGNKYVLSNGERELSIKDQVYFLRNSNELDVKNGTLGEVMSTDKEGNISIKVKDRENNRMVSFNVEDYNYVDHGYAATVHKAQGVTVDKAYVMASRGFNQHIAYVAMSRHVKDASLYWSRDEFKNFSDFKEQMGREGKKENALDYIESAKWYGEERGIEGRYNEIKVKENEIYKRNVKEGLSDNIYEDACRRVSAENRLEKRRVYNKGVSEIERFYGKKISKEFKEGEHVKFYTTKTIGEEKYGIFRTKDKEYKIMNLNRCFNVRENEEMRVCMATDGNVMGEPSENALWDRKVDQLSESFGKEVGFGIEVGDKGRYGGEIEFEGKRYGVMHQAREVKLIDKMDFEKGFDLKRGGFMKVNKYNEDKSGIIAVVDREKYEKIEMEKKQETEMELEKSTSKEKGLELEM